QISLPEPRRDGQISALVLFKYNVETLRFCPVQAPARLCISSFTLQRVSRRRALGRMLGPTPTSPGHRLRRLLVFVASTLRAGLSSATDKLYRDYRRRLLPEEGGYAGWVA